MVLLSKVEKSSDEFMEIMQNLSNIQVCFFWHIIFHILLPYLKKNRRIQSQKELTGDMFNLLSMGTSFHI